MSKNYEDYKPINPMPPRRRKNPMLSFVQYSIIVLLVFALVISGVYFMALHNSPKKDETKPPIDETVPPGDETLPPETGGEETGPEQGDDEPKQPEIDLNMYTSVELPKAQVNKGSLIYVSSNYKVVYPEAGELIDFFGNKSASYQISNGTMKINKDILGTINKMMDDFVGATGKNDIIIWTSYRDQQRQTEVYNEYVAQHGAENAEKYVAKPGESDHHTALGIAIRVFRNGVSYQLNEVDGYEWIKDNCYKYGFVERYPSDKIDVTGIDYSSTCYLRYVGVPQAEMIYKNDMCLEEYLILIKDYVFGSAHYEYTMEDGSVYEMYYVRADGEGDTVSVSVPKDKEYTVSGNNMDGFIVTVKQ